MKAFPILYKNKSECCGCFACYNICHNKAIEMIDDDEVFLYPSIKKKNVLSVINV